MRRGLDEAHTDPPKKAIPRDNLKYLNNGA
jgi:hypothetical protein